jgi:hypothetical protein
MCTLVRIGSPVAGQRAMKYVSSDKFTGDQTREDRRCRCGALPTIVRHIMDPTRRITVRMLECHCGERSWTEHKD